MKHCTPDELVSFVDGACTSAESARVRSHLDDCTACTRTVIEQESVKRLLSACTYAMVVPAGLGGRVSAALDAMPPPPPAAHLIRGWKGPMSLSVVALVVTSGLWFARTRPRPADVAALVSVHRHAIVPPPGKTLMTRRVADAREWVQGSLSVRSSAPILPLQLAGVGACHVGDTPAAIWMYRAEHPVSLIEVLARQRPPGWPQVSPDRRMVTGTYGGYNVVVWAERDRTFALVSRLPPERLAGLLGSSP